MLLLRLDLKKKLLSEVGSIFLIVLMKIQHLIGKKMFIRAINFFKQCSTVEDLVNGFFKRNSQGDRK